MIIPEAINKPVVLEFDNFNEEIFESLPDFIKDKIKGSLEYAALKQPGVHHIAQSESRIGEDDLPF